MNSSKPNKSDPTSAEPWTFHPGDAISDRYQIVDHLGRGAFGEVHAARDLEAGRRVALKILKTDSVERDPKAVARMRQEAEILRALDHPNLVQVFDIGTIDEHEYLVMELLEGRSLDELIEAGDLATPDRLRPIVAQILSALEAMHHRDVQHRDIKPDNIILLEDDEGRETVKLVDFGIAKARDFLDGEHEFTLVQTQEDEFVGTPRYTAPEQAVGDPVGPGGDLFSLGLVAAEWLTGEPRIEDAGERGALSILIQPDPIDVSDCPTDWQPWLVRMVAKKPEERFSSVVEALEQVPGIEEPDAWLEPPSDDAPIGDEDPTVPLRRDHVSSSTPDRPEPAAQVGEPGDPLEPTEVSTGPDLQTPAPGSSPGSNPPRPNRRQRDDGPSRRSTMLRDEQTTAPPSSDSSPRQSLPQRAANDAARREETRDEDLDNSTLLWTIAAAAFFVASLALFLYTLLTS